MFDEEDPREKETNTLNRNLEPLSVHELTEYIQELKAEIKRVEADIKNKDDVFNAANSVFKS